MDRRAFLTTLAGGLLAAPLAAAAQPAGKMPRIGIVMRSAALALLVLLAWSGAWAWWIHDDEVQQRELRRRLKRIDWGGE
jgi:hypothetical protein